MSQQIAQRLTDLLRVEVDASDLVNKIDNNSGQNGTTGWKPGTTGRLIGLAAVTNPTRTGPAGTQTITNAPGGKALRFTYTSGDATRGILSPAFAVAPGQWIGAQVAVADSRLVQAATSLTIIWRAQFYNSSDQPINASGAVITQDQSDTLTTMPANARTHRPSDESTWPLTDSANPTNFKAPATAVSCRILIGLADRRGTSAESNNGWGDVPTRAVYVSRLMAVVSDSQPGVVPYATEVWQNLLGSSTSVQIARGGDVNGVTDEIEAGTMTAVILDATLDPSTNPRIRPGRRVRISATPDQGVTWSPLFTGRITDLGVSYAGYKGNRNPRPTVTITAADAIAQMRGVPSPYAYQYNLATKITALMDGTTVPFSTNTEPVLLPANKSALIEGATLWDQIQIACNSYVNAKCWIDPAGTLQAKTLAVTAAALTFTNQAPGTNKASYQTIDANFGTKSLVNRLSLTRINNDETDGEKEYGPYLNAASSNQWSTIAAELRVVDGTPDTLAKDYLAKFSDPSVFPDSITFNALEPNAWAMLAALKDLYTGVRVILTDANLDRTVLILGIEHEITPAGWSVTWKFRPSDVSTTVTVVNSSGAGLGPSDVIAPPAGPIGRRTGLNQSFYSASWTTVALGTAVTLEGGITWDATNNRYTVPRAGRYLIVGLVSWRGGATSGGSTTGRRIARIMANTTTNIGQAEVPALGAAAAVHPAIVTTIAKLAAGDVIQLQGYQNSGAALATHGGEVSSLTLTFLGD